MEQKQEESRAGSDHPCAGCLHFYGSYDNNVCCNYIFDVGKRRPCPPGEDCTVKDLANGRKRGNAKKATEKAERKSVCIECGKTFTARRASRVYCCDKCKCRAWHRKNMETKNRR